MNIKDKIHLLNSHRNDDFRFISMLAMEEMGELIQALSKANRVVQNFSTVDIDLENIKEEMADVLVCIERLKDTLKIEDDDIEKIMKYKIERTIKRNE